MRIYIIPLIISMSLLACQNQKSETGKHQTKDISESWTNKAFPKNLEIKSSTHELILNTNLFNQYILPKGETTSIDDALLTQKSKPTEFFDNVSGSSFINFIEVSKLKQVATYGVQDKLNFTISFDCPACLDATLVSGPLASSEFITGTYVSNLFSDPASKDVMMLSEGSKYSTEEELEISIDGLTGIYLLLRDQDKSIYVYELMGVKADGIAPVFIDDEECTFEGNEDNEGLVCITTKPFKGNDYTGYNVPLKGFIAGDVEYLYIDGKSIQFKPGNFYKRMHIILKSGYNQIPVILKDKFSNTTESYIEVTIDNENSVEN